MARFPRSAELVEELEGALAGYPGAVVIVTHDRRMRTRFTGTHLELGAGHITRLQPAAARPSCRRPHR
ncbi:hypothetical protein ACOZ38_25855 [Sphaerisporangium viridialbum]|uniref:hypothetical protein n=1 Tax=Sphaerisporangium viridialbum TaxID=46189 RepID=UPI003C75177F